MKKIISAITISALMVGQLSAMQPAASRTAAELLKHFGKKAFSGTMTGLHWYIAAGASFKSAIDRIKITSNENKFLENHTDADERVSNLLKPELQKITSKQIDAIKIDPGFSVNCPIGSLNKHVLIAQSTEDEILKALKNNDQKTINKWLGITQHEAGHIDHNDLFWRSVVDLTLPFVTHGSVKIIRNILPFAKKIRPFLQEQFIKIPTALGKEQITLRTRMSIYRHQEQQRDDGVENNVNTLNGIKDFLNDIEQINIKSNSHLTQEQYKRLRWASNFLEQHPLPTERIKKLDPRIALLEKSQENQQDNS